MNIRAKELSKALSCHKTNACKSSNPQWVMKIEDYGGGIATTSYCWGESLYIEIEKTYSGETSKYFNTVYVPIARLEKVISSLKKDVVDFDVREDNGELFLVVTSGEKEFKIKAMVEEDNPPVPIIEKINDSMFDASMNLMDFVDVSESSKKFMGDDYNIREAFDYVQCNFMDDSFKFVATNGKTAYIANFPKAENSLSCGEGRCYFSERIIKLVKTISTKYHSKEPLWDQIRITSNLTRIDLSFVTGRGHVSIQAINPSNFSFPDVIDNLPKVSDNFDCTFELDKDNLIEGIKTVSQFCGDEGVLLQVLYQEDRVKLFASSSEIGEASWECGVNSFKHLGPGRFGINFHYFLDAVNRNCSSNVKLMFNTGRKPIVFQTSRHESIIVMPMRLEDYCTTQSEEFDLFGKVFELDLRPWKAKESMEKLFASEVNELVCMTA